MNNNKPLDGIKVLELATYVAAPTCARLLGDLGADVIKIETEKGDAWRDSINAPGNDNPRFHISNSGKRSIVLDLKTEDGMTVFNKLLADTDVFITNVRAASLKKMGLDHETVRAKHPKLIYAGLTAYGLEGPEVNNPGFDAIAFWARSGFFVDMSIKTERNYPIDSPIGAGDLITSMFLFSSVLAALIQRSKTGEGDFVTSSLYNSGIWVMSNTIALAQKTPGYFPRTRERCNPDYSAFLCADNEWIQMCIMEFNRHGRIFYETLGYPDLLDDPRFSTAAARYQNNGELVRLAEKSFATKTVQEWLDIFRALDIPCSRIDHYEDIPNSEQAWANDYLEKVVYSSGTEYVVPTLPMRMESQGTIKLRPAPSLGEDTEDILAELDS